MYIKKIKQVNSRNNFFPRTKNKLNLFAVTAKERVNIGFEETIDKIKWFIRSMQCHNRMTVSMFNKKMIAICHLILNRRQL